MKHLTVIAFAALAICLAAKTQSSDTVTEVISLERSFSDALLRADGRMLEQLEADDLIFTNANGTVTHKSDDVDSIKSDMRFESIEMSELKVQDLGHVAVVTGKLVEKGRYKTTDLSGTYRFTDVWAKRNDRWQLVAGQETRYTPKESTSTSPHP